MLAQSENLRYTRQIRINEIGQQGQEKIKNARVIVVGTGGLGCPALLYLASMGVGEIGMIDNDIVDETNLNRQILFSYKDLDKPKVLAAKNKLKVINPNTKFNAHFVRMDHKNALDIFSDYDIIVECSDNFATKYLSNDACVILDKPLVYGAASRFEGQVAVFNYKDGPTLRCLYPEPPSPLEVPSCSVVGVLGSVPGIIGTIQATEVIKIITGVGKPIADGVLSFDFLTNNFFLFPLQRDIHVSTVTKLTEYDNFCDESVNLKEITASELKNSLNSNPALFILDVRNPKDEDIKQTIGSAINIPAYEIPYRWKEIPRNCPVIVFCRYESQSRNVISYLQKNHGFNNLINLKDGIAGWEMFNSLY